MLEAICDEGVTVVTLSDGKAYTREALDADPMALIMSLLVFIRANEESAMKSKRLKAAWVGKRQKATTEGRKVSARCPGWLRLDKTTQQFVVIEERAEVVQRIYREAAAGVGLHTIAERLNADGIPVFGSGKLWYRSYVAKILDESPSVIGTYIPKVIEFVDGKKVRKPLDPIEGYYPAVVPMDLYRQVRSIRDGLNSPTRRAKVHNIFAGLVRCARCGSTMTLQNKGQPPKGARYFVCVKARYGGGCKYTAVRYDAVEAFFLGAAPEILATAPSKDTDGEKQLADIDIAMEQLEDRKATLVTGYERTKDTSMLDRLNLVSEELELLRERRESLKARLVAASSGFVDKRIAELRRHLKVGVKELDRAATNAAVRSLFSGLSLNPDTGIATLGWRHGGISQFTFAWPASAKEETAT